VDLGDQYNPIPKKSREKKSAKGKYGRQVPKYRQKEIHKRDKGYCQHCGRYVNGEGKAAHHIIFRSHANPYHVHDIQNLITLCGECHNSLHGKDGRKLRLWCEMWSKNHYGKDKLEMTRRVSKSIGVIR